LNKSLADLESLGAEAKTQKGAELSRTLKYRAVMHDAQNNLQHDFKSLSEDFKALNNFKLPENVSKKEMENTAEFKKRFKTLTDDATAAVDAAIKRGSGISEVVAALDKVEHLAEMRDYADTLKDEAGTYAKGSVAFKTRMSNISRADKLITESQEHARFLDTLIDKKHPDPTAVSDVFKRVIGSYNGAADMFTLVAGKYLPEEAKYATDARDSLFVLASQQHSGAISRLDDARIIAALSAEKDVVDIANMTKEFERIKTTFKSIESTGINPVASAERKMATIKLAHDDLGEMENIIIQLALMQRTAVEAFA
jgi:hypothetical protein